MARAKFDPVTSGIIGKVGGQNLSYTNNGFIIRPTIYTKSPYSPKRSIQRNITRTISAKWATLTAGEKLAWQTAAVDYSYTNSIGNTITRNNFETFSFCNQNRNTVGLGILTTAPAFYPITPPTVTRETSSQSQFVIKASVADSNLEYSVFVTVNWSQGYQAYNRKPLLTTIVSYADLIAGYDIMPDVKNTFPTPDFITSISVKIFAIHPPSGNKDLNGVYLNGLATYTGLGLDIISYYPLNGTFNDEVGSNNMVNDGATLTGAGVINGAIDFNTPSTARAYIPYNSAMDISPGVTGKPMTVIMWVYKRKNSAEIWANNRRPSGTPDQGQYQLSGTNLTLNAITWDIPGVTYLRTVTGEQITLNTWNFYAYIYNGDSTQAAKTNTVFNNTTDNFGSFVKPNPAQYAHYFGGQPINAGFKFNGALCEIAYINGIVSDADLETIRLANLAGQTILDIN